MTKTQNRGKIKKLVLLVCICTVLSLFLFGAGALRAYAEGTNVASVTIGDGEATEYETLEAAFTAINDAVSLTDPVTVSATVQLIANATVDGSYVSLSGNQYTNITLDLNGKSISNHTLRTDGGTLRITDSASGEGMINEVSGITTLGARQNGKLIIAGGTFVGGVCVAVTGDTGSLEIEGGIFTGYEQLMFSSETQSLNISGGSFQNGMQVFDTKPTVSITGGSFQNLNSWFSDGSTMTIDEMLPNGYLPRDIDSKEYYNDLSVSELTNIEIVSHTHSFDTSTGGCTVGECKTSCPFIVTVGTDANCYYTLAEAFNAIYMLGYSNQSLVSATVKLMADATVDGSHASLYGNEYTNITLDLNGKSISNHTINSNGGTLTITDTGSGEGKVNGVSGVTTLYSDEGGTLIIEGGIFVGGLDMVLRGENSSVEIKGGRFTATEYWSFDSYETQSLKISGGVFEDVLKINDAPTVSISGGSFKKLVSVNGTLTIGDMLPDGYLPQDIDSAGFYTDLSVTELSNIKIVSHTHDSTGYMYDGEQHWLGCECGYDADSATKGDHTGGEATCEVQAVCGVCGASYGELADHTGGEATCTEQAICDVCEEPYGELLEHSGGKATCTDPAICDVCEEPYGESLGHEWDDGEGKCTREGCGALMPIALTVDSYESAYFVTLYEALYALGEVSYDKATLVLRGDVTESRAVYVMSGALTVDLAGYELQLYQLQNQTADITVIDSSTEKSGCLSAITTDENNSTSAYILLYGGSLTVKSGSLENIVIAAVPQYELPEIYIEGGSLIEPVFTGNAYALTVSGGELEGTVISVQNPEDVEIAVVGGTFSDIYLFCGSTYTFTLADVFSDSECMSYKDADGNDVEIDLTQSAYGEDVAFTVLHDDSKISDEYDSSFYAHWHSCDCGKIFERAEHSFGADAKCTVCGKSAPFIVEYGTLIYGFDSISEAFEKAYKCKGSVLTLYDDAYYVSSLSYIYFDNASFTVDLNGNNLGFGVELDIDSNSDIVITDSSEDKEGIVYFESVVCVYGSASFTLDGVNSAWGDYPIICSNGGKLYINGGSHDGIYVSLNYNSMLAILSGSFTGDTCIYYNSTSSYMYVLEADFESIHIGGKTLASVFDVECMSCKDENGEDVVFGSTNSYYEYFTVEHSDEYINTEEWIGDGNGTHWHGCASCDYRIDTTDCSGGEATCTVGAVCSDCGCYHTDPLGHDYDVDGICALCGDKALVRAERFGNTYYYDNIDDAVEEADNYDNMVTVITLLGNVISDDEDLELDGGIITIDLAGFVLYVDDIELYDETVLTLTDSSTGHSGYLILDDAIEIYEESELIFEDGNLHVDYVEIDIYDGKVTVNGGSFGQMDVDLYEYGFEGVASLTVNGAEIGSLSIYVNDEGDNRARISEATISYLSINSIYDFDFVMTGGEVLYEIGIYGEYYSLSDLIREYGCLVPSDKRDKKITFEQGQTSYSGYLTLAHDDSALEDLAWSSDGNYHWQECECGMIVNKSLHTGGNATCEELAECSVCENEYGDYASHSMGLDGLCTICEEELDVYVSVKIGEDVFYYESFSEAMARACKATSATVTLLDDVYESTAVYIYEGNVTVDLSGYELDGVYFYLYGGALTFDDSSEEKSGAVLRSDDGSYPYVLKAYNGKLTVNGGHFKATISLYGAQAEINGGKFTASYAIDIYNGSTVTVNGGVFDCEEEDFYFSGNASTLILRGGEFPSGIEIENHTTAVYTLDIVIPTGGCYVWVDESGNAVSDIEGATIYDKYLKLVHTPSYSQKSDADAHWEECACGERRNEASHAYDNACDADCNVCGEERTPADHAYDSACDADCNACGEERTPADHVYDNACDTDCNVCGEERTPADHVYDNACDTDCNVCGAQRAVAEHVWGTTQVVTEPTESKDGTGTVACTVCATVCDVAIPAKGGLPALAVVAISVGGTVVVGCGAFSLFWFVIKKKKWLDLIGLFK